MRGGVESGGSFLRLDALVHGIGMGDTVQREAVAVVGKHFHRVGLYYRVEFFPIVFAMYAHAEPVGGFDVGFRRFTGQSGLSHLPKVHLFFGAQTSAGSDRPATGYGRERVDLPLAGVKVGWMSLAPCGWSAQHQHRKRQKGFREQHRVMLARPARAADATRKA